MTGHNDNTARTGPPAAHGAVRGELRIAREAGGGARCVLVLEVHGDGTVQVALTHPYSELATDADVVVPAEWQAATWPVVVQSDLRSVVWASQLGDLAGRLSAAQLDELNDALDADGYDGLCRVGIPLSGPADGRWEFKRTEGDDLRRLAARCVAALLADSTTGGC